jgi:hypothetical protein
MLVQNGLVRSLASSRMTSLLSPLFIRPHSLRLSDGGLDARSSAILHGNLT